MGSYRICACVTRKFRVTEAEPPEEVKEAFRKYAEGGSHLTVEQLRRFLVEEQGEAEYTVADVEAIVQQILQKYHHVPKFARGHTLTLDDFHHYLFSVDLNPPIISKDRDNTCGTHKMFRINQRECFYCVSIPRHLTLEDHLTSDLQAKVAQMLTQTYGEMLFYPESDCLDEFPSPDDLKYRVIISTKPPKEYLEAGESKDKKTNSQKDKDSDDDVWGEEPSSLTADKEEKEQIDIGRSDSNQDYRDNDDDDSDQKGYPAPAYKRLIAIHAGKPKGGLSEALKVESDKVRRLSLSEQALEKAAESHGTDIVRFTQRNILRVYPKGTRFNSSNYKPLVGWMHGAQMVAFNMQGYGRSLWLMQGVFRANGGCGYVKKPDFLMSVGPGNQVFDPKANLPAKRTLKVTVFMGDGWHLDFKQTHFDSYSPPDFYTRVGIAGVPADEGMKKTKKKEDNWTPVWNEKFTFSLTVPELALLRIEVHEYDMSEKDDFAGQTCLPVSEIKPGIRSVPLHNRKGEKYPSVRLLMRFEFV